MMAVMGGFDIVKGLGSRTVKTRLSGENFGSELEVYEVDFSTITKGVIIDKSKGDAIAKALVVVQTSWFAVQCIARAIQGIPVTKLELTTLGHTAFICFVYFFWWNKPLCVVYPLMLQAKLRTTASGWIKTEERVGAGVNVDMTSDKRLSWRIRFGGYLYTDDISRLRYKSVMSDLLRLTFILLVAGTFGAIHCLGWNSHFLSHVEQILWRVSALIVTVNPIIILVIDQAYGVISVPGAIITGLYVCARLCLLTVAFLSLRRLPFAAYQIPSWTNFIPHL